MKKYLEILKKSYLFTGIEDEQLLAMLKCLNATVKTYQKGNYIFHFGDAVSSVGIVLSGSVHILREDYWGNRLLIDQITPGQLFGEASSCAQTTELPVSVVCAARAEIMFFDYRKIITVCSSACSFHNRLIQNMLKAVAQKNLAMTQKMTHMSQKTTRDKLLSYLSAQSLRAGNSTFTIPFNRQQLADYLCVDRSAMSNELSKMQREGLLDCDRYLFTLYS